MFKALFHKLPAPQSPVSLYLVMGLATVGFLLPKMLPLIPVLMGLLWIPVWRDGLKAPENRFVLLSGLGFMVWALVSCFWSPDIAFSLEKWGKSFALLVFICAFLSLCGRIGITPAAFDKAATYFAGTLIAVFMFLCIEYQFEYALSRFALGIPDDSIPKSMTSGFLFNRSSVFATLMMLPAILMIVLSGLSKREKRNNIMALSLWAAALAVVAESQTAGIALALIPLSFLYPVHKKIAQQFFIGVVAVLVLLSPVIATPIYKNVQTNPHFEKANGWLYQASAIHRLEVWNFLSHKIAQKPVFGHGMESTRHLRSDTWMPHMKSDRVMHPHNLALQLWLEFGIVGVALFLCFFAALCQKVFKAKPVIQKFAFAQTVSVLGVLAVGYGLWQAWQLGMIATLAALIVMAAKRNQV